MTCMYYSGKTSLCLRPRMRTFHDEEVSYCLKHGLRWLVQMYGSEVRRVTQ